MFNGVVWNEILDFNAIELILLIFNKKSLQNA